MRLGCVNRKVIICSSINGITSIELNMTKKVKGTSYEEGCVIPLDIKHGFYRWFKVIASLGKLFLTLYFTFSSLFFVKLSIISL